MISNKHARFVNIKGDAVRNFRLNGSSKSILLQVVTWTLKPSPKKLKLLEKLGKVENSYKMMDENYEKHNN